MNPTNVLNPAKKSVCLATNLLIVNRIYPAMLVIGNKSVNRSKYEREADEGCG
jgi:hypothetical protein